MEIKKILFVTDFEELWFDSLQSLMVLRKAGLDHIVLLHVIERSLGYYTAEEKNKLREIAEVRFIDWAQSIYEEGLECGSYIVVGDTVSKIQDTEKEEGVDLVVISNQKRTKMEKLYIDSKTLEFLRKTSKPALVYKYKQKSGKINDKLFEVPLLAMDWSPAANRALEFLVGLKSIVKKIQVVHVATEKSMEGLGSRGLQKMERENRKKLDELCSALEGEGIDSEYHFLVGDLTLIEKAAQERNATMIVSGTSRKSAWQARWLGSVSQKLAEVSELPILLIS